MNQEELIASIQAHGKLEEEPQVVDEEGRPIVTTEYDPVENTIVLLTEFTEPEDEEVPDEEEATPEDEPAPAVVVPNFNN